MGAEKYQRICSIGKGACGDVFLVRSTHNQKCYALKRVELDESRKTRKKESVLREARIMAELRHPHIVRYHESFFDVDEKNLCIILDYCDGGTLEDKIRDALKTGTMYQEKEIVQWFLQIAMAVRYLHSQKVLHRDLKTENVFLNKSGTICKLGDFGIAKSIDKTIEVSSTCVGTPCYLSPEMCQDIPYTSKADVWALGCILYELCALKPAFDAHNLVSLFYKIVKAEYEPIPDEFSDDLVNVLEALLTKEPEDRPSAQEVLAMPFLRKELLLYIEENEFKLQQFRLPTREGPRPYSTPSLRDTTLDLPSSPPRSNDLGHSKVKRAVTCRPTLLYMNRLTLEKRHSISAKPREGVGTIEEETDEQVKGNSESDEEKSQSYQLTLKGAGSHEPQAQDSPKVASNSTDGPKNHPQKKTEVTKEDNNRSDLHQEEKEILRSVKGLSKTPELIRRIVKEEKVRSRSLTPDSAKMSCRIPRKLTRGKENRFHIEFAEFEKPYTNLMDVSPKDFDSFKHTKRMNLDLSNLNTSVSQLKLHDGKLPHIPPLNFMTDGTEEKNFSNRRKQIQEPQRTPRVPIKNALRVELDVTSDEEMTKVLHPDEKVTIISKPSDSKAVVGTNKKQRHDSELKMKEKETETKSKAGEQDSKSRLKLPKLKPKQAQRKTQNPQNPAIKITKDHKSPNKKAANKSKKEKKQEKIERLASREGTEIYYSDDFDEDSSCSEIEEDIPEEIVMGRGRSVSMASFLESADIPEDLPDGEEGTDLDSSMRGELDAVVTVAREVHDGLADGKDELVVDTAVRQPSANILIQRALETSLGQENMKTFYLMNALMKTKKK